MKIVFVLLALLGLSACDSVENRIEQRLKIQSQLPEGCNFRFYGFYGQVPVVAITCDDRETSSISLGEGSDNSSVNWVGAKGSK